MAIPGLCCLTPVARQPAAGRRPVPRAARRRSARDTCRVQRNRGSRPLPSGGSDRSHPVPEDADSVVRSAPQSDRFARSHAEGGFERSTERRRIREAKRGSDLGDTDGRVGARVETQSSPERDNGGQCESRGEVAGELVVACGDASEVLEAAEDRLDPQPERGPDFIAVVAGTQFDRDCDHQDIFLCVP